MPTTVKPGYQLIPGYPLVPAGVSRTTKTNRPSALLSIGLLLALYLGVFPIRAAATTSEVASAKEETKAPVSAAQQQDDTVTFLEDITVTASQSPTDLQDVPGTVTVISAEAIEDQLVQTTADLVRYEPGVYVESDVTRLGLNGFNIRGLGGNRVMTRIDGVDTAEQFDFGPLAVHQVSIDIDSLASVEIVRSAASSLYGSDALGGVVSLETKDPSAYLGADSKYLGAKWTYDGRDAANSLNLSLAIGNDRLSGSLFASTLDGSETDNQGTLGTTDETRTKPNPQSRTNTSLNGKVVFDVSTGNRLRAALELTQSDIDTKVFSLGGTQFFGPVAVRTLSANAVDTQNRSRFSLDQTLSDIAGLDLATWNAYFQDTQTEQALREQRQITAFGPPISTDRFGTLDLEQQSYGTATQVQKALEIGEGALITAGLSAKVEQFDVLRNRSEFDVDSGAAIPSSLVFPSKYFPKSKVTELGAYAQAVFTAGPITITPGLRYDNFRLNADQNDLIYLAGLNPPPVDFSDGALAPKLGIAAKLNHRWTALGQYSRGFRAPPYSAVNTGFTNVVLGYTTLPNTNLDAETSDNYELGIRANYDKVAFSLNGFSNRYTDFIELVVDGFNPRTNLLEFTNRNLTKVEIEGIELRAEAYLSRNLLLRFAYAAIDGIDVSGATDVPLASVAPNEGVLGVRYLADSGRWGGEASVRVVERRAQSEVSAGEFAPPGFETLDLVSFLQITDTLKLRLGVTNLTDEKIFEWWNVRGRIANDPALDRYTSAGRNVVASLAYSW